MVNPVSAPHTQPAHEVHAQATHLDEDKKKADKKKGESIASDLDALEISAKGKDKKKTEKDVTNLEHAIEKKDGFNEKKLTEANKAAVAKEADADIEAAPKLTADEKKTLEADVAELTEEKTKHKN